MAQPQNRGNEKNKDEKEGLPPMISARGNTNAIAENIEDSKVKNMQIKDSQSNGNNRNGLDTKRSHASSGNKQQKTNRR